MSKIKSQFLESKEYEGHFKCDCHTRDHSIDATHETFKYGDNSVMDTITLEFNVIISDYNDIYKSYGFIGSLKRYMWRLKYAFRILIKGELKYKGEWLPVRRYGEAFVGIEEFKKLGQWMIDRSEEIEKNKRNCLPQLTEEARCQFEQELIKDWDYGDSSLIHK